MRPLDKGPAPVADGEELNISDYGEWRKYLIDRIGYYCAYCNIPLSHSLNVEHVVPKSPQEGNEAGEYLAWENMLLACGPCNNTKGNKPTESESVYLPESNNTLMAFDIVPHPENKEVLVVAPGKALNARQKRRAQSTIGLLGLDRIDNRDKVVDIRWKKRTAAVMLARTSYQLYLELKASASDEIISLAAVQVAKVASETGFFQIWFTIFKAEPRVMSNLLDSNILPGTALECFDKESYQWLNRNNDNPTDPI